MPITCLRSLIARCIIVLLSLGALAGSLRANENVEVMVLQASEESASPLVKATTREDLDLAAFEAGVEKMINAGQVTEVFRGVRPLGGMIMIADKTPPLEGPDDIEIPMGLDLQLDLNKSPAGLYDVACSLILTAPNGKKYGSSEVGYKSMFLLHPGKWVLVVDYVFSGKSTLLLLKADGKLGATQMEKDEVNLETKIEMFSTTENDAAKFLKSSEGTRDKAVEWFRSRAEPLATLTMLNQPARPSQIRLGDDKIIDEGGWSTAFVGLRGLCNYRLVDHESETADLRLDMTWSSPEVKTTEPEFEFKQSLIVKQSLTEMIMPSKINAVADTIVVALVTTSNIAESKLPGSVTGRTGEEPANGERQSTGDGIFSATYSVPVNFLRWLEDGRGNIPDDPRNPNPMPPRIDELLKERGVSLKDDDWVSIQPDARLVVRASENVHDMIEVLIKACKEEGK